MIYALIWSFGLVAALILAGLAGFSIGRVWRRHAQPMQDLAAIRITLLGRELRTAAEIDLDLLRELAWVRGFVLSEPDQPPIPMMDLIAHLNRQRAWSEQTFGPGSRTAGVLDHIRKELGEIERAPQDLKEWVDVILLALDGAWRHGHSPETIAFAISAKQAENESRVWPDWRTQPRDRAIEHVRV